jgi:allantoicase
MSKPDKVGKVYGDWLVRLRQTKSFNVATVALANKLARIAWAVMTTKQPFNENFTPKFAMTILMTKTVEPLD